MANRKPQLTEKALVERIERIIGYAKLPQQMRDEHQPRELIAGLCAALEDDFPKAARALARGAGMAHLYDTEDGQ